jgi:hypothetical protein
MKENKQNIFTELTDSIKSKLYDFHYSPFMSSFITAWIIINHKYLLILFSPEKLELKLKLLNNYQFGVIHRELILYTNSFIFPLLTALFYVFFYPSIALFFYKVTLIYQKQMRDEKQRIEEKTTISSEEKETLINELYQLKNNLSELRAKYINSENEYQSNIRQKDEIIKQSEKQLSELKKFSEA